MRKNQTALYDLDIKRKSKKGTANDLKEPIGLGLQMNNSSTYTGIDYST
jgi:hypothetical protein